MGMAASQGRFLGLTARKTNVEYEGQQINQQRTALSNQSATYNNQLLGLNVPTAPSTDSFSKTAYAWTASDGTTTNTITNLVPDSSLGTNGYNITYTKKGVETGGFLTADTDSLVLTQTVDNSTTPAKITFGGKNGATTLTECSTSENTTLLAAWKKENPTAGNTSFYKYTNSSTGAVSYYADADLKTLFGLSTDKTSTTNGSITTTTCSTNAAPVYKTGTHSASYVDQKADATIDIDSSGRMTAITIGSLTYTLDTKTTTDEAAYNDAMNKYEYDKNVYNKEMDNINAKISIIQIQDKSLELKLKQCDTEQSAISTELDAVKKVISKNVESSFKTFNA